jgi:hypothetical protein
MVQDHSTQPDVSALRKQFNDFTFDTIYGKRTSGDKAFDNKLGQVLNTHRLDCDRRLAYDAGSPAWFLRVRVNELMAMLLMTDVLERRAARLNAGQRSTDDEWSEARYLMSALDDFGKSGRKMAQRFPAPDLSKLAELFWFYFFNLTVEDAHHGADSIRSMFSKASEAAA